MPIQSIAQNNTQQVGAAGPACQSCRNQACSACQNCPGCAAKGSDGRAQAQDLLKMLKKLLGIDEQGTQQGIQDALKDPKTAANPVLQQVLGVLGLGGAGGAADGK